MIDIAPLEAAVAAANGPVAATPDQWRAIFAEHRRGQDAIRQLARLTATTVSGAALLELVGARA